MKFTQYTKQTIILLSCLLSLMACSNSSTQNTSKSLATNPTNSPETNAVPPSEILRPKQLPILGDSATQQNFQIANGRAIMAGTPRPTNPPILAVLAGNPPNGTNVCTLEYSALTKLMYENCFPEGIGYIQMSNVIGWAGENVSQSGDTTIYKWGGGEQGILTATFTKGHLIQKSQVDLH